MEAMTEGGKEILRTSYNFKRREEDHRHTYHVNNYVNVIRVVSTIL